LVYAQDNTKKPKSAATPEDAIKYLVEALNAADIDLMFDQFTASSQQTRAVTKRKEKVEAEISSLLDARFGKDATKFYFEPHMAQLKRQKAVFTLEVVKKSELARDLCVLEIRQELSREGRGARSRDLSFFAIKEKTGWRLLPATPEDEAEGRESDPHKRLALAQKQDQREFERAQKELAALRKIVDGLQKDQFRSRDDAWEAFLRETSKRLERGDPTKGEKS